MEYSFGNMDEGQIIFHPHIPNEHSDMDLSQFDTSKIDQSDNNDSQPQTDLIEKHQDQNLQKLADELEKELDLNHIDKDHYSDYIKGKTTTIDDDEDYDYDISKDENKEVQRLDLNEFKEHLLDETLKLNTEFLEKTDQTFSEYLALTMNQLIFDRSLSSKEFIDTFRKDENTSESLDRRAQAVQKITDQKVMDFIQLHVDKQTAMVKNVVN